MSRILATLARSAGLDGPMRAKAPRLVASALGAVVVSLGAFVAWLNLEHGEHEGECHGDGLVDHIHLPGGWILWA
jgi:uncharacterized membrane protein YccC